MVGILQAKKPSNTAGPHYPRPNNSLLPQDHVWQKWVLGPGYPVRNFQPLFSAVLDSFFTCSTPSIMYDISKN